MTATHTMNLAERFAKLREDLLQEGGPSISTIQNFRFAILRYAVGEEFAMRRHVQELTAHLEGHGWMVLTLDLQAILSERIRAQGPDWADAVIRQEKELVEFHSEDDPLPLHERAEDGLRLLQQRIGALVEGEGGLAASCSELIAAHVDRHPAYSDRTLVLIGRAGVLYPFLRTSSILRQLDGHTRNLPVVLLYPGEREGQGLSFMGVLAPDNDYRPRIYG